MVSPIVPTIILLYISATASGAIQSTETLEKNTATTDLGTTQPLRTTASTGARTTQPLTPTATKDVNTTKTLINTATTGVGSTQPLTPTASTGMRTTQTLRNTATRGVRTTQTLRHTTATTASTFSFTVEPVVGPVAGGTMVTIARLSSEPRGTISAVYFGSDLLGHNISRSGQNVTVITPPFEASPIGQSLSITVEIIPGSFNVSTNKFFTYAPNPEVYDVNPKAFILSGGIRLTVSGSNLSSVVRPLIRGLVVVNRIDGSININETFAPCESATEGGTKMSCLSPPLYVPDDFLDVLFGKTNDSSYKNTNKRRRAAVTNDRSHGINSVRISSRQKRQAEASVYTNQTYLGKNGQDTLELHIGVIFDGYLKYSDNIPSTLGIFLDPSLTCPAAYNFDPSTDEFIKIKGANMSRCCSVDSYTVSVGNGFCIITDLTDNQLTCQPPKIKPAQTQSDIEYCGQNIAILVEVGYKKYQCSCMKYSDSSDKTLITIIVATVGSSLILFIIIILASIIIEKRQKRKKRQRQDVRTVKTRDKREILRSARRENDGRDLVVDATDDDPHKERDGYRSYPSEKGYTTGGASSIDGSDRSRRYTLTGDNDGYLETIVLGSSRGLHVPGHAGVYAGGNTRGIWNENSYRGRQLTDEIKDYFNNSRPGAERQISPRIYFNQSQDRRYGHRMKY